MANSRSRMSTQKGLGKVRKARIVVMLLLIIVAITIVLIDKNENTDGKTVATIGNPDFTALAPASANETIVNGDSSKAIPSKSNNSTVAAQMPAPAVTMDKNSAEFVSIVHSNSAQNIRTTSIPVAKATAKSLSSSQYKFKLATPVLQLAEIRKSSSVQTAKTKKRLRTSSSDSGNYHLVKKGETLSEIALKHYGDTNLWLSLFRANRKTLSNPRSLVPGQKLILPPKGQLVATMSKHGRRISPKSSPRRHRFTSSLSGNKAQLVRDIGQQGGYYRVLKGDSLTKIAKGAGISFLHLYDLNKKALRGNADVLQPGTRLWIPVASPNR